jgi:hypothetical protein
MSRGLFWSPFTTRGSTRGWVFHTPHPGVSSRLQSGALQRHGTFKDTVPSKTPDGRLKIDLPYIKKSNRMTLRGSGQSARNIREITNFHWSGGVEGFGIWVLGANIVISATFRTSYGKSDTKKMTNRGMARGTPSSKMKKSNPNDHL